MAKKYIIKRINKAGFTQQDFDETRFSINYKSQLNEAQFEAATALYGSYLVIAGAGTGKTRTLVYRVARLVEIGTDPSAILLLTFTRKAAKEMMERAAMLLDNRCSRINGGTFHSFANLTLRKYGRTIGLNPQFTILDQSDSQDIINLIRSQMNIDQIKRRFPKKNTIFNVISLSRNTGVHIKDILEKDYPHFARFLEHFIHIDKIYDDYKKKNSLLDYDDLLVYLRDFLTGQSAAAKEFLGKIQYVMVDEYQDTNKLQAEIVKGLTRANNNIMAVGDDSQSIYSFRGANFKNIMDFPNLFDDTRIIKLEENYRSTEEILNFTNNIIDAAIEKYPKVLYTRNRNGDMPVIISATNENMQSRFIADRILELREEGVELNDMAVLFRSSYFSFDLEIELNKANIPYLKFGGMKFMDTAHVKDLISFLRISSNPSDMISWYRVLLLHEGIGPKKAQQIMDKISSGEIQVDSGDKQIKNDKLISKVYSLFKLLQKIQNSKKPPAELAEIVYTYYDPLFREKYDDFNKRKKDLDIFLNIAENYKSLNSFLTDLALEPPTDSVGGVDSTEKDKEFLTLSTIHSAKGLEWHSVFIIHALEGFFPSSQSFEDTDAIEEERRLMYVAATRAKRNLYICYPMNIFDRQQGITISKPSRFIENISEDLAEEWLLEEEF